MKRTDLLLAALAAGEGRAFEPVQLQKALFLLTNNIGSAITEGDPYNFKPFDFGPFDKAVYDDAEQYQREGYVDIAESSKGRWNVYSVTEEGGERGKAILEQLPEAQRNYIKKVSDWVLAQDFAKLVKSIYEAYPDMRVNSIFRG